MSAVLDSIKAVKLIRLFLSSLHSFLDGVLMLLFLSSLFFSSSFYFNFFSPLSPSRHQYICTFLLPKNLQRTLSFCLDVQGFHAVSGIDGHHAET